MSMDFAIVIPAYARPKELSRLLRTVRIAKANINQRIPVIVSIDGDNRDVIRAAQQHGDPDLEVIIRGKRLGLRQHILECGDLSSYYRSILVLEDDLILSPVALRFVNSVLPSIISQSAVASLSLHNFQFSDLTYVETLRSECVGGIFYAQTASSWGQVWWNDSWSEFRRWLGNGYSDLKRYRVPKRVMNWPNNSWKKLFNFWLSEAGYYSAAPLHSFSLCSGGETGTNVAGTMGVWSSRVRALSAEVDVKSLASAMKLDPFLELETIGMEVEIPGTGIHLSDVEFDLAGSKMRDQLRSEYVFTRRRHPRKTCVRCYCADLANPILALMAGIEGDGLYLLRSCDFVDEGNVNWSVSELRSYIPWISSMQLMLTGAQSMLKNLRF